MFTVLALLGLGLPAPDARATAPDFLVIVHPKNPLAAASREFLTDAFLKKTTRWGDDETLLPVDLKPDSPIRKRFSESVLRRSVAAVRAYWQQKIFSGRGVPPPELESDDAVVEYVQKHRGAVGYVSSEAKLEDAKVLAVR